MGLTMMKSSLSQRLILMVGVVLGFAGCSSAAKGRVVETESGVIQAIGTAKDEPDARVAALDGAQAYCAKLDQKPIFKDRDLKGGSAEKRSGMDLKNLPLIGDAFKDEDKTQVIMSFRCKDA
jgi:hypothetical protein